MSYPVDDFDLDVRLGELSGAVPEYGTTAAYPPPTTVHCPTDRSRCCPLPGVDFEY
ncbi:hypothetical protein [Nocardia brasiliensis]|uniref:hypothetical protein n=1 Tax=Nocardia brasiliensis TaxID=37326 RepID=UPI0024564191|nr:hypothetical protein [Nocardia brasiliensis]